MAVMIPVMVTVPSLLIWRTAAPSMPRSAALHLRGHTSHRPRP